MFLDQLPPSWLAVPFETVLFFGTFNPVHLGHVAMAQAALGVSGIRRVVWVPTGDPPHRTGVGQPSCADTWLLPIADRLQMANMAAGRLPNCWVWTGEADPDTAPHYTVATLRRLRPDFPWDGPALPDHPGALILASCEALAHLASWREADTLVRHVHWLQVRRADTPHLPLITHCNDTPIRTTVLETMTPWRVSATQVRERVLDGSVLSDLVPSAVATYLEANLARWVTNPVTNP